MKPSESKFHVDGDSKPKAEGSHSDNPSRQPPTNSRVKAKPQYIPFKASKTNVFSNVVINSLFGLGLYYLYKDYQEDKIATAKARGTVTIVHERADGTQFKGSQSRTSSFLPKMSYRDLSFVTVGFGFLLQLANMAHVSFGKKSPLYRASVLSVALYPPFAYYMYTLRDQKAVK
ncbi:LAQU0S18e01838g1_1 [Lachancea quebecensis]|uniref:LAQU0S18e01838g1_1 n=1 Tax=Lachancea quebecensis TaxID=1654605 RepID=A0A0P1KXE8_9SACH|nr:LAQU0S18e01838g1_1 [Lachancea quebecensis]